MVYVWARRGRHKRNDMQISGWKDYLLQTLLGLFFVDQVSPILDFILVHLYLPLHYGVLSTLFIVNVSALSLGYVVPLRWKK